LKERERPSIIEQVTHKNYRKFIKQCSKYGFNERLKSSSIINQLDRMIEHQEKAKDEIIDIALDELRNFVKKSHTKIVEEDNSKEEKKMTMA